MEAWKREKGGAGLRYIHTDGNGRSPPEVSATQSNTVRSINVAVMSTSALSYRTSFKFVFVSFSSIILNIERNNHGISTIHRYSMLKNRYLPRLGP